MDRLEQLQSKLQTYTVFGLPKVPRQLSFHHDSWEEEDDTNLSLEDSWQTLLDNSEVQSRNANKILNILIVFSLIVVNSQAGNDLLLFAGFFYFLIIYPRSTQPAACFPGILLIKHFIVMPP